VDTIYDDQLPKNLGFFASPPNVTEEGIVLLYEGGDFCPLKGYNRSTQITFQCDEGAGTGSPVFELEDANCRYFFNWETVYACERHCWVNPCLNGGSCVEDEMDFAAGFNCSCPLGFQGGLCEESSFFLSDFFSVLFTLFN